MILKSILLILLPVLLTGVYLIFSDKNFVGVIAFAMLVSSIFMTNLVKKPIWGLFLLIAAMQWFQLMGLFATLYLIPVGILFLAFYVFSQKDLKIDKWWWICAIITFGYVGLVFVARPYKIVLMFFFMNMLAFLLFMLVSLMDWTKEKVQYFLNIYLFYMISWAFIERLISYEDRIEGPSLSSTNFGVFLAVAWIIWFINGWMNLKYRNILLASVSLLVAMCVFLSGTRMGILGMGMGMCLAFFCYLLRKHHDRIVFLFVQYGLYLALIIPLGFIVWYIIPDGLILKKGMATLGQGRLDYSSIGRIGAWLTALDVVHTDPLWGVGPGNFLDRNMEFLDKLSFLPINNRIPRLGHAHNLLLMVLSEHGLIGFCALISVCGMCFARLVRYILRTWDPLGLAFASGILVTIALGMFDVFPLFPSSLGFGAWMMAVAFSQRPPQRPKL